jgi:hypothetical protein
MISLTKQISCHVCQLCVPSYSILINCAGRFLDEEFKLTHEGIEQTLALDYYAHFLLSLRLLDTLTRNGPSRIINMSRCDSTIALADQRCCNQKLSRQPVGTDSDRISVTGLAAPLMLDGHQVDTTANAVVSQSVANAISRVSEPAAKAEATPKKIGLTPHITQ